VGYRINLPERRVSGAGPVEPLVTCTNDGVVVSAVKLADDGSGDVVVRVYEALGARARTHLALGFEAGSVAVTDLLERPLDEQAPALDGGAVELRLRPFQIVTLRFTRH
jgi:alpha-mannosidase